MQLYLFNFKKLWIVFIKTNFGEKNWQNTGNFMTYAFMVPLNASSKLQQNKLSRVLITTLHLSDVHATRDTLVFTFHCLTVLQLQRLARILLLLYLTI